MARPKSGRPVKKNMCIVVTPQTREVLAFVSKEHGESISNLVAGWAEKEAKAIRRRADKAQGNKRDAAQAAGTQE